MSAKVPVVHSISWFAVVIIVLIWVSFMAGFALLFSSNGIFIGMVVFSLLGIVLQLAIPQSHRKGMKAVKKRDFTAARKHFEDSAAFFTRYKWIDTYRVLTLFSISKMYYHEIALCNIAFCYAQTDEPQKAKALYEQILEQYPENGIAYYGLKSIQTFSTKGD